MMGLMTMADYLQIDEKFSRHIIQAATRVNYASNLAYLHGLETMVSSYLGTCFHISQSS
jgi:hypothetical protein